VAIWSRDGGKSTNAELACLTLGARNARKYALYISGTQDQADDHVASIADALENPVLEDVRPELKGGDGNTLREAADPQERCVLEPW